MSAPVCPRRAGEPAPLSAREEQLYGVQTTVLHRDAEHAVYRLRSSDGEVIKTCYPVFPGITITYNDVHASYCQVGRAAETGLVEINHCREGRVEYQLGEDYFYLAPGDLSVTLKDASPGEDRFPTGHYHGITVDIDPARAPDCLSCFLEDVTVRPGLLAEKFCCNGGGFAARSSPRAEHVFSELYSVPEEIRKGYFKVKILELLLFLSTLPAPAAGQSASRGLTRTQTELARRISEYLLARTEQKVTVSELAEKFGVSAAQVKSSFQGVYGMTPAAFLRAQKMHGAAEILRKTDRTVLDIAGQFGYDNASKFAKAFRDVIGVSPNAYRSGIERDSCAPESPDAPRCPGDAT